MFPNKSSDRWRRSWETFVLKILEKKRCVLYFFFQHILPTFSYIYIFNKKLLTRDEIQF